MKDVLLVDDDGDLLQSTARAISPLIAPLSLVGAGNAPAAIESVDRDRCKVAVVDLCLDERVGIESGFTLIRTLRTQHPELRIIVLTGNSAVENGLRAIELGASSFLEKPVDPRHLAAIIIDAARYVDLRRERDRLSNSARHDPLSSLAGSSQAIAKIRDEIRFAASTNQPVVLLGETGTGKSLCARLIHETSARREMRFVSYTPTAGSPDLVQSELFGHLKGAFTGAAEARRGLAREAHGGTLFLDELDEYSPETQVRLLDLVQQRRVRAVGADVFDDVDCRVVAAFNRPLDDVLSSGKLRKDLYHRLAHCVIALPPLRDRRDDIPEIAKRVVEELRLRERVQVFGLEEAVIGALFEKPWEGNVRELTAFVENAAYRAAFNGRERVTLADIPSSAPSAQQGISSPGSFHEKVEAYKCGLIDEALRAANGSQVQAAKMLGLDRGTLRRILGRNS